MVFPIVGGDGKPTGYEISNSLRFNDDDNPYLARTPSSSGSRTKATVSFWVKRGNLGSKNNYILEASSSTSPFNMTRVRFNDSDQLVVDNTLNGGADNGFIFTSDRLYRDVAAWYHIFFSIDVTEANASDAWRLYVNGVQQTKALTHYTQDANLEISQSGVQMNVGRRHDTSAQNFDGYLAEYHYIDGTIKTFTDFGEFNDNGVWIPKEYDGGSYGTNGFYFKFEQTGTGTNSSGMGADSSGNDNHFAVNNLAATDVTEDTCTNNFATFNSQDNYWQQYTYAEGGLKVSTNADYYNWNTSTIGVRNGKWYVEAKATQVGTGSDNWVFGVTSRMVANNNDGLGADNFGIAYRNNGNYKTGDANNTHGAAFSAGDIVMIALDLDNDNVYFGHNGQWADGSGNTDESSPTSAVSLTNLRGSTLYGDTVFFAFGDWNSNASSTVSIGEFNFGNAPYSLSSPVSDGKYGNFEYAPPSGYYALCTKRLAEFG